MNIYGFAQLRASTSGVVFYCTDSTTLENILTELQKIIPDHKIAWKSTLLSGETYGYLISNLHNKDGDVSFWIAKQPCLQDGNLSNLVIGRGYSP
jgi:hypothetical protein